MKITYFINQYPKVSHTFIRREILALEKQGFEIQRIALRGWSDEVVDPQDIAEKDKTNFVLQSGIAGLLHAALCVLISKPFAFFRTLFLACKLGIKADRPLPYHIIYFLEACKTYLWVNDFKSQHMHAHFGTNPSEILMLVNALSSVPYSFTVHGPEEFDRPVFLKLKEKISSSKFVVAVSSFGRSQLLRWIAHEDWHKVKVVHCGLESDFYQLPFVKPAKSRQLVCVGRLCEQKGQVLLIEAARVIHDRGVDFRLVLAGDGEMRAVLETLIKLYGLTDKVSITGWISSDQVREEILASRALVLPSFAEGLPVVIMEAMSLRRPVISTYIAGIPELVQNNLTGWLVPAGSLDQLIDAMMLVIESSPEKLEELGMQAYQRVVERHNIDVEASKLANYIRNNDALK